MADQEILTALARIEQRQLAWCMDRAVVLKGRVT